MTEAYFYLFVLCEYLRVEPNGDVMEQTKKVINIGSVEIDVDLES